MDEMMMYLEERMNALFEAREKAMANNDKAYADCITNRLEELEMLANSTRYEVRYNYRPNKSVSILTKPNFDLIDAILEP